MKISKFKIFTARIFGIDKVNEDLWIIKGKTLQKFLLTQEPGRRIDNKSHGITYHTGRRYVIPNELFVIDLGGCNCPSVYTLEEYCK